MSENSKGYGGGTELASLGDVIEPLQSHDEVETGKRYVVDDQVNSERFVLLSDQESGFFLPGVYDATLFRLVKRKEGTSA